VTLLLAFFLLLVLAQIAWLMQFSAQGSFDLGSGLGQRRRLLIWALVLGLLHPAGMLVMVLAGQPTPFQNSLVLAAFDFAAILFFALVVAKTYGRHHQQLIGWVSLSTLLLLAYLIMLWQSGSTLPLFPAVYGALVLAHLALGIEAALDCGAAPRKTQTLFLIAVTGFGLPLALLAPAAMRLDDLPALGAGLFSEDLYPGVGLTTADLTLFIWLFGKLCLNALLISLLSYQSQASKDSLEAALTNKINEISRPFRATAQALYHMPTPILLAAGSPAALLYANGQARLLLGTSQLFQRTLDELFIALVSAGANQYDAVFEGPQHELEVFRLTQINTQGTEGALQVFLMDRETVQFETVASLLIDNRQDAPGSGAALLDSRFSLLRTSAGWQQVFGRQDRYAQSGLLWDKLRLTSPSHAEIARLEDALMQFSVASGSIANLDGHTIQFDIRLLRLPDSRLVYLAHARTQREENETEPTGAR